jgi:hypothetical protein
MIYSAIQQHGQFSLMPLYASRTMKLGVCDYRFTPRFKLPMKDAFGHDAMLQAGSPGLQYFTPFAAVTSQDVFSSKLAEGWS